jgi:SAM-dependent methyltransferase
MGAFMANIPLFAAVEPAIVECFRHGGGVPDTAYHGFTAFMAQLSAPIVDATLLQSTLPLVPGLTARLHAGIDVADMGCGAGHALNVMARAFPRSQFTGYDFSPEGIAAGQQEAQQLGLTNARFVLQDLATLDVREVFDLITVFDAIHDQAQPRTVLTAIYTALRPGGTYLMADVGASSNLEENFEHPLGPFFFMASVTHCMTVSLAQGGEGLGNMWGEQTTRAYLTGAGFRNVVVKKLEGDLINNFYICAKE